MVRSKASRGHGCRPKARHGVTATCRRQWEPSAATPALMRLIAVGSCLKGLRARTHTRRTTAGRGAGSLSRLERARATTLSRRPRPPRPRPPLRRPPHRRAPAKAAAASRAGTRACRRALWPAAAGRRQDACARVASERATHTQRLSQCSASSRMHHDR